MVSISAGHHPLISHIEMLLLKGTQFPVKIPKQEYKEMFKTTKTNAIVIIF